MPRRGKLPFQAPVLPGTNKPLRPARIETFLQTQLLSLNGIFLSLLGLTVGIPCFCFLLAPAQQPDPIPPLRRLPPSQPTAELWQAVLEHP